MLLQHLSIMSPATVDITIEKSIRGKSAASVSSPRIDFPIVITGAVYFECGKLFSNRSTNCQMHNNFRCIYVLQCIRQQVCVFLGPPSY